VSTTTTHDAGDAEPDDRVVSPRLLAPAGLPPVVDLPPVAELRPGLRRSRHDQRSPIGEEVVVGVDHSPAQRAGGEIRQPDERVHHADPLLSKAPHAGPSTSMRRPRSHVWRTAPRSTRPWYGVIGWRWASCRESTTNA
jgi:hypothetical protein